MLYDHATPIRRRRRPVWRRSPRVVGAGLAAAVLGSLVLGGDVYGALGAGQPQHVRVHAGDSLWAIAAAHYPGGDIRERVDEITSLNHLSGVSITPGEDLLLPAP